MKCLHLTVFPLLVPLSLFAEPATLEPVTVTSTRMERPLADTPAAVTVVDAGSKLGQPRLQLDESLNRVPGLYLQNRYNFAQGLRLSSRGFGSRAPFGVRGLRLNVDGFPETLPDGQSQLDSIDLFAVEQLTVLRGPSSLFYGNATGGVVDITTQSGKTRNDSASVSLVGGSHGLKQANVQTTGRHDQGHHALSLTALDYPGFREQSEVRKYQFTGQAGWDLADTRTVTVFLTAMDTPVAQDPGGLTRQQAHQDRRQASRFASRLNAGQQVDQQRLGLHYRDDAFANGLLNARAFISQRDFRQQLPFPGSSLIDYQRLFYGARLDYTLPFTVLIPHRLLLGVDMDRQEDDRGRQAVSPTGNITAVTADEDQQASADGIFLQLDSHLSDSVMLTIGGRADRLRMTIDDALLTDGNDSGRREFAENSYSAGLSWQVSPAHTLYTTVSSAFESPTFTELANPSGAGGFNPDLEPQTALNREVGARGALGDRLFYEAALFRVDVDDEITPYEIGGRTFYQNAGQTRRDGLELGLEHATTDQLTLALSWTWSDFRFQEFFDTQQNVDVSGERLPGIPQHQLFAEIDWQADNGLFASVESLLGSHRYAENTNRTRVGSEWLVNVRGGKAWTLNRQTLTLFASIDNLLDRDYYSNLRINANSDRPVENRGYFEPGPGTGYYAGFTLDW
ncbi:TonB-dependent receptor family protein [Alcanivorax sp. IL2]|uniref:TonB-dependent receptor family protein n=1 Tax=Alcanivorax sp. IL2 TaxID=3396310 RepID=UPI0039C1493C